MNDELLGEMKPAHGYGDKDGQPVEQGNATHETREAQLRREIPDLKRYVKSLEAELRELTGEDIADPPTSAG